MSEQSFNSWGTLSQNGILPDAPPGFRDEYFEYVAIPVANVVTGVCLPSGSSIIINLLIHTDSHFIWDGLEIPSYATAINIRTSDGYYWADRLVNSLALNFGKPQFPIPVFPALFLKAGTTVKIDVSNLSGVNISNYQVIFRGMKRYPK